jgi:chromosome segregation ATPase
MLRFRKEFVLGAVLLSSLAGAQIGPLLTKGQQALDAGRYSEALRLGTAAVAKGPKVWQAHRLVGRAAVGLDQPDRAEKAYALALKFVPAGSKAALQKERMEVAMLRRALAFVARSETLRKVGELVGAAEALSSAYSAMPKRYAYGIESAELFEKADRLEDARQMLDEVRGRTLPQAFAASVKERLEAVLTKIDAVREAARLEKERKEEEARKVEAARAAAEKRRAQEAERKQIQEEQRREEERQKAEREQKIKEEKDRLERQLSEDKSAVSDAESEVRRAESRVSDAEREVRDADSQADRARSRRDDAKHEVDDWKDKVDSAKTEVAKEVYRSGLRAAESKYDDAKNYYERAKSKYDDAKSRQSSAQSDLDNAKRKLDGARQDMRDTEDAINRLASGG